LGALYRRYRTILRRPPGALDHLYHNSKLWEAELVRLTVLAQSQRWKREAWALCAAALIAESQQMCRALSKSDDSDVDSVLERIDQYAKRGNSAMAGYLVYLNRYAFFAGKLGSCETEVREIDLATHRLRQELRQCRSSGAI